MRSSEPIQPNASEASAMEARDAAGSVLTPLDAVSATGLPSGGHQVMSENNLTNNLDMRNQSIHFGNDSQSEPSAYGPTASPILFATSFSPGVSAPKPVPDHWYNLANTPNPYHNDS